MEVMRVLHLLRREDLWRSAFFFIAFFGCAHVLGSSFPDRYKLYQDGELTIPFSKALVIGNKCQVTVLDTDNKLYNNAVGIMLKTTYYTCSFDFYHKKNIYYTYSDSISSILDEDSELKIPANYNAVKNSHNIYEVAVDFINNKLYIITVNNEVESDKLMVFDKISGKVAILINDLTSPKFIEVDPFSRLLFIQHQSMILKANMDGTSRVKLEIGKSISIFTIDRKSQTIFWATSEGIEKSNYNLEHRRKVTYIEMPVRGLAVLEDELLYIAPPPQDQR